MSKIDKIRAWKDEEYRDSLSTTQKAELDFPVGDYELDPEVMKGVVGGDDGCTLWSLLPSEGRICTISAECWPGGGSCNPFPKDTGVTPSTSN